MGCLRHITSLEEAFCGDSRLKLRPEDIEQLVKLTLEDNLPKDITGCYHQCLYTQILSDTVNIVDIHVLPVYHAFLLGVLKSFFKDLVGMKVKWQGRSVTLRSILWVYNERLEWLQTTSDFGRKPNIIVAAGKGSNSSSGTLFPHWTCEDYLDHVLVYMPLLLR